MYQHGARQLRAGDVGFELLKGERQDGLTPGRTHQQGLALRGRFHQGCAQWMTGLILL